MQGTEEVGKALQTSPGDLATLLPSWERSLRAENKSASTITVYTSGARQLLDFLQHAGMPTEATAVRREHVESFIADILSRHSSGTAATRYRGVQQWFKWLEEEGEIQASPMAKMRPPKVDERPVPVIPEADLAALFKACAGRDFVDRRDTALIRVFLNTGGRLAEISDLHLEHVDLDLRGLYVTGKGRKGRGLPLGAKAVKDLDRYLRARARHRDAGLPWLWLTRRGRMTDSGVAQVVKRRSEQAGIDPPIHVHQFRHTFSHLWLSSGGNEHDLAKINGWSSLQMVARYASSAAIERARNAHARIDPGAEF